MTHKEILEKVLEEYDSYMKKGTSAEELEDFVKELEKTSQ